MKKPLPAAPEGVFVSTLSREDYILVFVVVVVLFDL